MEHLADVGAIVFLRLDRLARSIGQLLSVAERCEADGGPALRGVIAQIETRKERQVIEQVVIDYPGGRAVHVGQIEEGSRGLRPRRGA